jgi:7-cyano-7-deazaguanine synthase
VHALTIDYGQRNLVEIDRARTLARALGAASHRVIQVDLRAFGGSALTDPAVPVPQGREPGRMAAEIPPTYVPARNTVLLALALAWAEVLGAFDLFLGVNAVDYGGYPDCRPEFLEAFEALAAVATRAGAGGARFRVHAPLLHWTKGQIVREALRLGIDPAVTLSCYVPDADGRPCGRCDACWWRARGFREAGEEDPGASRA